MEDRFKLLKIFGLLFKVMGWAALVVGIVGAVGVLVGGGAPQTPRAVSLAVFLSSALYFILFYTLGEIIRLLLAIEAQTRK